MKRRNQLFILAAVLAALPGIILRLAGLHWAPAEMALISGVAILGASFLLLWACDAAQGKQVAVPGFRGRDRNYVA